MIWSYMWKKVYQQDQQVNRSTRENWFQTDTSQQVLRKKDIVLTLSKGPQLTRLSFQRRFLCLIFSALGFSVLYAKISWVGKSSPLELHLIIRPQKECSLNDRPSLLPAWDAYCFAVLSVCVNLLLCPLYLQKFFSFLLSWLHSFPLYWVYVSVFFFFSQFFPESFVCVLYFLTVRM